MIADVVLYRVELPGGGLTNISKKSFSLEIVLCQESKINWRYQVTHSGATVVRGPSPFWQANVRWITLDCTSKTQTPLLNNCWSHDTDFTRLLCDRFNIALTPTGAHSGKYGDSSFLALLGDSTNRAGRAHIDNSNDLNR